MAFHARINMAASTGCQPMAPLKPSLICVPADALQTSQGRAYLHSKQGRHLHKDWERGTPDHF